MAIMDLEINIRPTGRGYRERELIYIGEPSDLSSHNYARYWLLRKNDGFLVGILICTPPIEETIFREFIELVKDYLVRQVDDARQEILEVIRDYGEVWKKFPIEPLSFRQDDILGFNVQSEFLILCGQEGSLSTFRGSTVKEALSRMLEAHKELKEKLSI